MSKRIHAHSMRVRTIGGLACVLAVCLLASPADAKERFGSATGVGGGVITESSSFRLPAVMTTLPTGSILTAFFMNNQVFFVTSATTNSRTRGVLGFTVIDLGDGLPATDASDGPMPTPPSRQLPGPGGSGPGGLEF